MLTAAQSRAARGLLDWSQGELGERCRLSESTIRNFEKGRATPSPNNLDAIGRALETAGVEFIPENGGGAGVRMRKSTVLDHDAVTAKIADLDAKAEALKHDGTPSPANALKTMKRAVVKNEATKLRNKLVKAKGKPGQERR